MTKKNKSEKVRGMSVSDLLLGGISYDELITAVHANHGSTATANDVLREYKNILSANMQDAEHLLKGKGLAFVCSELGIKTEDDPSTAK